MIARWVASILRRLARAWCAHYEPGRPGAGDCDTDGHYLCAGCSQMSAHAVRERGGAA